MSANLPAHFVLPPHQCACMRGSVATASTQVSPAHKESSWVPNRRKAGDSRRKRIGVSKGVLGTRGGPRVGVSGRSNPSNLILVNDVPYVIDCGYGTTRQLLAAGVPLDHLRYIFITHHHSDHNLEFGTLFYNAWVTGLPARIDAYGPAGWNE